MKKHIVIPIIIIGLSLSVIFSSAVNTPRKAEKKLNEEQVTYILKSHNGRVALFENTSSKPEMIFDVFTDSLPTEDQIALKNGIEANSKSDVEKLLEEYLS